jgi:Tfp pilus assembly protein PilX
LHILTAKIKQVLKRKTYWTMMEEPLQFCPIDMKNNPMTTVLLGVLTLSALASVVLCLLFTTNTRQKNLLQSQATSIINKRTIINALANDVVEYGKKNPNPAIDSILESVNLKPAKSTPAATTKTATK